MLKNVVESVVIDFVKFFFSSFTFSERSTHPNWKIDLMNEKKFTFYSIEYNIHIQQCYGKNIIVAVLPHFLFFLKYQQSFEQL